MATRNKLLILLIVVGIILFGIIRGIILPQMEAKQEQYLLDQQNPVTHDLESLLPYKYKYMGKATNLINLYQHLPLAELEETYHFFPEKFTVEITYKEKVSAIDEFRLKASLIYNSVAAFSLIDNLEEIHYIFSGDSFTVTRSDMKRVFGENLSELLTNEMWKEKVQDRISDKSFTLTAFQENFINKK
ncbi:DUF4825 domain-containing protein [Brevibacillus daliensis]|uniref:DUF4825 domain-containing protein n=1 Tax=Brevibacillus daliensis TaxID=2892995 RepID=UPI001E625FA3|nr:DUF4825 domain-containing protein [Brevibacillus daliensis]